MDTGERDRVRGGAMAGEFGLAIATGAASAELVVVVEEQIAGCWTVLDREGRESAGLLVSLKHTGEVDVAEDVDVMEKEGRFFDWRSRGISVGRISLEKPRGSFEAAAGVE